MHIEHNNQGPHSAYEREYLNWYNRRCVGRAFDPHELVRLAREQWTDRPALAEAFARCTREWPRDTLYTHFRAPLEMRRHWKFAGSLPLAHPALGTLLVDVLHDESVEGGLAIGGMEYLDRVLGRHAPVEEWQRIRLHLAAMKSADGNTN